MEQSHDSRLLKEGLLNPLPMVTSTSHRESLVFTKPSIYIKTISISREYMRLCFLLQLNDKDEALAHQRKVSIMLARSAEELQRRLHRDSHGGPADPSEDQSPSCDRQSHQSPASEQGGGPSGCGQDRRVSRESRTEPPELSDPSQCDVQPPSHHEADIRQKDPPES